MAQGLAGRPRDVGEESGELNMETSGEFTNHQGYTDKYKSNHILYIKYIIIHICIFCLFTHNISVYIILYIYT